jgi:glycopeptide antibiotics resistance protein
MRVSDLVNLASEYFKLGIVAMLFIALVSGVGYFFVYRKLLKDTKKIGWEIILWWGVLICYLVVVFGATLWSRSEGGWSRRKIEPLFYSYRDAWINFSGAAWRNIILNFCMFIPFGLWLPIGRKKFRKAWKTYLAGFALSLTIELLQFVSQRGRFEFDDLLGNTVGTMIGYGLYAVVFWFAGKCSIRIISVAVLQLPLILTVAAFAIIFAKYDTQELGNNPYHYIEAYDNLGIYVNTECEFRTDEEKLNAYETVTLTLEEAKVKGEEIFERLGTTLDEGRMDVYDGTIVLYSNSENYCLWIDYQGGTFSLTCFDVLYPQGNLTAEKVSGADEGTIRKALGAIGFEIPEEAVFRELESGDYQFEISMLETDEGVLNGTFACSYYGELGIGRGTNNLIACTPYKEYPVISEQEAYEKILQGEFKWSGSGQMEIQVESCSVEYCLDSKGFYQPNYQFACVINGEEGVIVIPAIQ